MQLTSRALEAPLKARITALTMSVVYELYCVGLSSVIHALYRPGTSVPSGLRAARFSLAHAGRLRQWREVVVLELQHRRAGRSWRFVSGLSARLQHHAGADVVAVHRREDLVDL